MKFNSQTVKILLLVAVAGIVGDKLNVWGRLSALLGKK